MLCQWLGSGFLGAWKGSLRRLLWEEEGEALACVMCGFWIHAIHSSYYFAGERAGKKKENCTSKKINHDSEN